MPHQNFTTPHVERNLFKRLHILSNIKGKYNFLCYLHLVKADTKSYRPDDPNEDLNGNSVLLYTLKAAKCVEIKIEFLIASHLLLHIENQVEY